MTSGATAQHSSSYCGCSDMQQSVGKEAGSMVQDESVQVTSIDFRNELKQVVRVAVIVVDKQRSKGR